MLIVIADVKFHELYMYFHGHLNCCTIYFETDFDYINLRNSVLIISLQNEKVTMK